MNHPVIILKLQGLAKGLRRMTLDRSVAEKEISDFTVYGIRPVGVAVANAARGWRGDDSSRVEDEGRATGNEHVIS